MAELEPSEWRAVHALLERDGARFGLPETRTDSVVLSSFNIRSLGGVDRRPAPAWEILARYCSCCDLIAVQEVMDDLNGLGHLMELMDGDFGMVASDITGGVAGRPGYVERLAFLFRWTRVQRTEVASDITVDRSAVVDALYEHRWDFLRDLEARTRDLAVYEARKEAGGRPRRPPFVLQHFLTFLRTPLCVSFRIPDGDSEPYELLAVNAHLLYGDRRRQRTERELEFRVLVHWLVERSRQAARMYHPDILLLGDLNLDFEDEDARREEIGAWLKSLNRTAMRGASAATAYFPFLDPHPATGRVFRTNVRKEQTYDQAAFFSRDTRLPRPGAEAGSRPGGFDYGVFDFAGLMAEALLERPLEELTGRERTSFYRRFQYDVSDHLPLWIRLPLPSRA